MTAMPPTPASFQQPALVIPAPQSQQTQFPSQQPSPQIHQFQAQPLQYQLPPVPSKVTAQGQWPYPHPSSPLTPPSQGEIDDKPWKYLGYPGFSTWSASSKDAFVFRRFNAVHARVILYMQDQIVKKENELAYLDRCCLTCPDDIDNGTFRYDIEPRRNILLEDLRLRLKEYSKPKDILWRSPQKSTAEPQRAWQWNSTKMSRAG
ncbi:MAG: hypothetical protein M1830_010163 [Pleopsidium flavum]|nr:MAG: hypothetical protein M1830_010163 [Pleopsidium flavum]